MSFVLDAQSIFITAAIMVLVNGMIIAVVSRTMAAPFRSSALYWCAGTLLLALSGAAFGLGTILPRAYMLVIANGAIALGFTSYHFAICRFTGSPLRPVLLLPAAIVISTVIVFQSVIPSFQVRVTVVSIVWAWQMAMCAKELWKRARTEASLAANILTGLFALVGAYAIVRNIIYVALMLPANFAIETGSNWLNVLSPLLMAPLPIIGTTAFLLMCSDRLQHELERTSSTDYLTGLLNRRGFAKVARDAVFEARAGKSNLALAMFDIDKFKLINDRFGHDGGDKALIHVAGKLFTLRRPVDFLARTGGEEFVVLLDGLEPERAENVVDRIRSHVAESPFPINGEEVQITVSVGLAFLSNHDTNYEDVMRRADQALYLAKTNGRNRLEIASMDSRELPEKKSRINTPYLVIR